MMNPLQQKTPYVDGNNNMLLDPEEEESAFDWLQRVRATKRKLAQNPIVFPSLSLPRNPPTTHAANNDDNAVNDVDHHSILKDSSRLIVQETNVIHLSSMTFQCRTSKLNELIVRSQRWRRRRSRHNQHYHHRRRRRRRIGENEDFENREKQELTRLEELFLSSFSNGTGIEFIDRVLMNHRSKSKENIVFEIIGRANTAKTKVLQVLAANYAAATSIISMSQIVGLANQNDANLVNVPIVIFDPEHAVDFRELVGLVRVAILRKWNSTSDLRQCYERMSLVQGNDCQYLQEPCADGCENGMEYGDIEKDIQFALGRIHIVRPKDISHGYVSALESIQQSLDHIKETSFADKSMPPVLLLFDSMLSAFQMSTKMLESLPNGSGLSGLNDFIRQIKKLRNGHETIIFTTRTCTGEVSNHWRSNCDGWNKIVTHRISVQKSVMGSSEEQAGYDLVAICHSQNGDFEGRPIPFSVTSRGIVCEQRL